jgi:hypothetical protein
MKPMRICVLIRSDTCEAACCHSRRPSRGISGLHSFAVLPTHALRLSSIGWKNANFKLALHVRKYFRRRRTDLLLRAPSIDAQARAIPRSCVNE